MWMCDVHCNVDSVFGIRHTIENQKNIRKCIDTDVPLAFFYLLNFKCISKRINSILFSNNLTLLKQQQQQKSYNMNNTIAIARAIARSIRTIEQCFRCILAFLKTRAIKSGPNRYERFLGLECSVVFYL